MSLKAKKKIKKTKKKTVAKNLTKKSTEHTKSRTKISCQKINLVLVPQMWYVAYFSTDESAKHTTITEIIGPFKGHPEAVSYAKKEYKKLCFDTKKTKHTQIGWLIMDENYPRGYQIWSRVWYPQRDLVSNQNIMS